VKFVIDMNMGPEWIACLASAGYEAVHWSSVGPRDESDEEIMQWARDNDHAVLTADLDFGARLVRRGEAGPSVVQLRTDDTLVRLVGSLVLAAIRQTQADLSGGALVTIESERYRVRRLSTSETL
jgi:predicted nuclease of predicted toxin-antitoxin system